MVASSHDAGGDLLAGRVADHDPVGRRGDVEGVRRLEVRLVEAGEDAGRGVHERHAVDVVPAVGRVDAAVQPLAVVAERHGGVDDQLVGARHGVERQPAAARAGPRRARSPLSRSACTARGLRSTNVGPPCEVNRIVVTERKVASSEARSSRTSYPSTMRRSKRAWASVCWRLWKGFVTAPTLCGGTPRSRMGKGATAFRAPAGRPRPYRAARRDDAATISGLLGVSRRRGSWSHGPLTISGRKWLDVTNRHEPGPRPGFAHHRPGARPRDGRRGRRARRSPPCRPATAPSQPRCRPRARTSTASRSPSGTTPEGFTGKVIGVLEDGIAPDVDMIMVELSPPTRSTASGASGRACPAPRSTTPTSRLIGAVAYGLSWGPSPVAGVTPFADMDAYLAHRPRRDRQGRPAGGPGHRRRQTDVTASPGRPSGFSQLRDAARRLRRERPAPRRRRRGRPCSVKPLLAAASTYRMGAAAAAGRRSRARTPWSPAATSPPRCRTAT